MNVRRFQKKYKIDSGELIAFLKTHYPRFSKVALCMVSNPDKYGVRLTTDAEKTLKAEYAPTVPKQKPKAKYVTLALSDEEYERLHTASDGAVGDYLKQIIKEIESDTTN